MRKEFTTLEEVLRPLVCPEAGLMNEQQGRCVNRSASWKPARACYCHLVIESVHW